VETTPESAPVQAVLRSEGASPAQAQAAVLGRPASRAQGAIRNQVHVIGSEFGEIDRPSRGGYTEPNWDRGAWGDDLTGEHNRGVALPRRVLEQFGDPSKADFAQKFNGEYDIIVTNPETGQRVIVPLKDMGPGESTGAGIDMLWGTRADLGFGENFKGDVDYAIVRKGSVEGIAIRGGGQPGGGAERGGAPRVGGAAPQGALQPGQLAQVKPAPEVAGAIKLPTFADINKAETQARDEIVQGPRQSDEDYTSALNARINELIGLQHSQAVPAGDERVTYNPETGFTAGKYFVTDGSDPYHDWLLRDVSTHDRQILQQIQQAIQTRTELHPVYGSAPQAQPGMPTAGQRAAAQELSTAAERSAGTAPKQMATKDVIPAWVGVNKAGEAIFGGADPGKVAGNFAPLTMALGPRSPYGAGPMGPHFIEDVHGWLENSANGYKGDGSAQLKPVTGAKLPQPSPNYDPYRMSPEKSQFINAAVNGGSGKLSTAPGAERAQVALNLARENQGYVSPEGYVNPMIEAIDATYPKVGRKTWSQANLHPAWETLKVNLVRDLEGQAQRIHPGHELIGQAMEAKGVPGIGARAGFMPAAEFVSPNVREGTDFEDAKKAIFSTDHQRARHYSRQLEGAVAKAYGTKTGEVHDSYGDWGDGAENSPMARTEGDEPFNVTRLKTALGILRNAQKQGIAWQGHPAGDHVMYELRFDRTPAQVRDILQSHGILYKTILADAKHGEPTEAYILDTDGSTGRSIANLVHAPVRESGLQSATVRSGHGEFVGDPEGTSRDVAARNSREIIESEFGAGRHATGTRLGDLRDLAAEAEQNYDRLKTASGKASWMPGEEPEDRFGGTSAWAKYSKLSDAQLQKLAREGELQRFKKTDWASMDLAQAPTRTKGQIKQDDQGGYWESAANTSSGHVYAREVKPSSLGPQTGKAQWMPGDVVEGPGGERERIASPAVRFNDQIFTGINHPDAWNNLTNNIKPEEGTGAPVIQEGFTTSSGRFLTRDEAWKLAEESKQTKPGASRVVEGQDVGLGSEDLKGYPPEERWFNPEGKKAQFLSAAKAPEEVRAEYAETPERMRFIAGVQQKAKEWLAANRPHKLSASQVRIPEGANMTIEQFAEHLEKQNKALDLADPKSRKAMILAVTHDIMSQLAKNGNSVSWYDVIPDAAMRYLNDHLDSSILENPENTFHYKLAQAISSQDQDVFDNAETGYSAYRYWMDHGRLPTEKADIIGGGTKVNSILNNFRRINELEDKHGTQGLMDLLEQKMSVKQIKELGLDVGREDPKHETQVSVTLGPKIGAFYAALQKHFENLVMDKWFIRSMRRMAGSMMRFSDSAFRKQAATVRQQLTDGQIDLP
jgi:hypothetical protein